MIRLSFKQVVPLARDADGTMRVTGSRVTLDSLVSAFNRGDTAEQIQDSFPTLTLSQVYAVLLLGIWIIKLRLINISRNANLELMPSEKRLRVNQAMQNFARPFASVVDN